MKLKTFTSSFIAFYILLSLPGMLGIGYVIDWTSEATLFQKLRGYVLEGLVSHFYVKVAVSIVISAVLSIFLYRRQVRAD
ncbi:hypothetical protein [Jeotgalibacillus salarius]|uniref:Uncharacterized protein n=1 Tax=Jeotgalibacillus salarius TaxID=546023 RepID=A0A4Y8LDP2_9BACL|nr:hypothetical protein [Jeotgalibacillus salarius]TFE00582.1 hypothetical protein E2626_11440 [Jeotgalibacillus salarius]